MESGIIILYLIAVALIGFLLYLALNKQETKMKIYNEIPPQRFETHWWGYGWRPWWRRYGGVPGLGPGKPLPEPKMPVPPKPLIV